VKTTVLMKTSETKKFVQIFCEAFFILKNTFLKSFMTYFNFYKKGFLNSQAVRIRVNFWVAIILGLLASQGIKMILFY
jgi:hypothetical protein